VALPLALVVCENDLRRDLTFLCIERWLCESSPGKSRPAHAKPSLGCKPWNESWERGEGMDLDRVRAAAEWARKSLVHLPDFQSFLSDWCIAGLDTRRSGDTEGR
jgi:hypothetical protein